MSAYAHTLWLTGVGSTLTIKSWIGCVVVLSAILLRTGKMESHCQRPCDQGTSSSVIHSERSDGRIMLLLPSHSDNSP